MKPLHHLAVALVALGLIASSCRVDETIRDGAATIEAGAHSSTDRSAPDERPPDVDTGVGATEGAIAAPPDDGDAGSGAEPESEPESESESESESAGRGVFDGGGIDLSLTRDEVDCSDEYLNEDPDVIFTVAHYVVAGNLGMVCFGEPDPRLESAWLTLAAITPAGQLADLGLFGGFESSEAGDETTLAFVNTLDFAGSMYQMSINLAEGETDPDELMLTMAHEFTHVFTSLSSQIDRFADPASCETYYNGEGCYLPDSLMAEWVELFWSGYIDDVDPFQEASAADGVQRCSLDAGFLGAYAASNPEEDFAEAFSAFVFRLPVGPVELQRKLDWFAEQPGLAEFRELAVARGLGPLRNNFDRCG